MYNDSSENLGAISPGSTGYMGDGDDRRPSIASATTVSSTGSQPKNNSGSKFNKLQGFFGQEYKGLQEESRQNSESSSMRSSQPFTPGGSTSTARGGSQSFNDGGPPSPSDSRPRTPAGGPNSEVTPWDFQDKQVRFSTPRFLLPICTDRSSAGEQPAVTARSEQRPNTQILRFTSITPTRPLASPQS